MQRTGHVAVEGSKEDVTVVNMCAWTVRQSRKSTAVHIIA